MLVHNIDHTKILLIITSGVGPLKVIEVHKP